MEADFSGYATKAGLRCSDGRIIMPDAFKHEDGARVPLVWQHGHNDPSNILGHAILEARPDGIYAYGFFNDTEAGQNTKALVAHKDITMLSIYANQLIEKGKNVLHGAIREVSLVLSGANPGALIDNVSIAHSDGDIEILDDEAIIYTGLPLEHENFMHAEENSDDETVQDVYDAMSQKQKDVVAFLIGAALEEVTSQGGEVEQSAMTEDATVQDVYDSMTQQQKDVLHYMVGAALEEATGNVSHNDEAGNSAITHTEGNEMTRNVFEQDGRTTSPAHTLSHSDIQGIVADAMKTGSLKDAVESYALAHGIDNIDVLFPDAKAIQDRPEWISRRTEWVSSVLGATRKSPFSRIKTLSADLTYDEARAKGYIKGTVKKEEFFGVAKRVTTPTTIYKKQKLDRDDMIDITDFDVVSWLKAEMRVMLDEELARAVLFGDGRDVADPDKIGETYIRPVAHDDPFYTVRVPVDLNDAGASPRDVIDAIVLSRRFYKGTGLPTFYTTESWIGQMMVLKDGDEHRLYRTVDEIAAEMRVAAIVPCEVLESDPLIVGVLVNLNDYVLGADRGGDVSLFDDFDIDYNQYKYLIETRVSGALVKAKSAMVVVNTDDTEVMVQTPGWNPATGVVMIPTVDGLKYVNMDTNEVLTAGSLTVVEGDHVSIEAIADSGKILAPAARTTWTFRNRNVG